MTQDIPPHLSEAAMGIRPLNPVKLRNVQLYGHISFSTQGLTLGSCPKGEHDSSPSRSINVYEVWFHLISILAMHYCVKQFTAVFASITFPSWEATTIAPGSTTRKSSGSQLPSRRFTISRGSPERISQFHPSHRAHCLV